MERLTVKRSDGRWALTNNDGAKPLEQMERIPIAIDRLAAYEDTGLGPREINAIKHAFMGREIAKITEFDGIPVKRLGELAQAEKDGRLVVLPIPVGTDKVVYGITDSDDGPRLIVSIECEYLEKLEIWNNPGHEVVVEVDGWEIGESDIGKTVFLTREEAEAALEKRGADNETD